MIFTFMTALLLTLNRTIISIKCLTFPPCVIVYILFINTKHIGYDRDKDKTKTTTKIKTSNQSMNSLLFKFTYDRLKTNIAYNTKQMKKEHSQHSKIKSLNVNLI